jgi:ferric-dicitrate binding protein FerR (iron transport regulator)
VPVVTVASDIPAPTGSRTTLTLAGGQKITLDSVAAGMLAQQGAATVAKAGGSALSYRVAAKEDQAIPIMYNTLTTARGGQTQVTLADGSKVWLNAASSLRFPTTFSGSDRSVELTGEAYFEIAPRPDRPFIVRVNGTAVEVLGTRFDIMAYTDEEKQQTTLLEGAVRVSRGSTGRLLRPGQQAVLDTAVGTVTVKSDVDEEAVLAWKNGYFEFDGLDIQAVMRQVSRWYNVRIVYQGAPPAGHFFGVVNRTSNVSDVLKIFQQANIHYTISKDQITVLP